MKEGKGLVKEYDSLNRKLKFEGEYLNGERNGKGKEYWNGELIFEGEYLNGKRLSKWKISLLLIKLSNNYTIWT